MARTVSGITLAVKGDVGTLDQLDLVSSNPLAVALVDGNGDHITSIGGGTEYNVDSVLSGIATGKLALVRQSNVLSALHVVQGDATDLRADRKGSLWVRTSETVTSTLAGMATSVLAGTRIDQRTIGGTLIDVNTGNASPGTQRVVLATDQPNVPINLAAATTSVLAGTKLAGDLGRLDQMATGSINPITVAIVDASGNQITSFGGGTEYNVDSVLSGAATGKLALVRQSDILSSLHVAQGDATDLRADRKGALWVRTSETATSTITGALPAGDNNIGNVDIVSLPDEGQQTMANSISVAIASNQSNIPVNLAAATTSVLAGTKIEVSKALPAGTNNIGDVDIVSLPDEGQQNMAGSISVVIASDQSNVPVNLVAITTSVLAGAEIDVGTIKHVAVDTGAGNVSTGTQRVTLATDQANVPVNIAAATTSVLAGTKLAGDLGRLNQMTTGSIIPLTVAIVDAAGGQITSFGGGTEYDVDSVLSSTATGKLALVRQSNTLSGLHVVAGDATDLRADRKGALWVRTSETVTSTITGALPAGTNAIGKLAANSGVDIGDVDVTSIVPGTGATNLGKAEDAVHSSADVGVMPLAVRNDAGTALAADGDYIPLTVNSVGALYVTGAGGGTQYAEDALLGTAPTGTLAMAKRSDTLVGLVATEGDAASVRVDRKGSLWVRTSETVTTTLAGMATSVLAGTRFDLRTIKGVAVDVDAGNVSTGTQRVVIATDQANVPINLAAATTSILAGMEIDIGTIKHIAIDTGAGTVSTGTQRVTLASDQANVPANIAAATTSVLAGVRTGIKGIVPHDAVDSGEPVKVGMKAVAHGTNPAAVAANDRTDWYANRAGIPFIIGGHPNVRTLFATYAANQNNTVVSSIAAGLKMVLTKVSVYADGGGTGPLDVQMGFGASVITATTIGHAGIVKGSGFVEGDGSGILAIGADGEDLRLYATGFGSGDELNINVTYYTIES